MAMSTATKEQEKKAAIEIRRILESLGEGSYVGTALEGCLDIADMNIEYDFADSMKARAENAEQNADSFKEAAKAEAEKNERLNERIAQLEKEKEALQEALDRELEWHDCGGGTNMAQEKYAELLATGINEAKEEGDAELFVSREFGFELEQIRVKQEASTYEADRHGCMRVKQTFVRKPVYYSTDWNYIRFDCAGWQYEMIDGELYKYES